jgi:transcriptional regulator
MYIPSAFEESRVDVLQDLVIRQPFGVLVTQGPGGLDANHLPFHLQRTDSGPGILHGHVARANPVWKDLHDGDEVLVVFSIADAYISPNWYQSKHELHRQVPTWNYIVVHAHGQVTLRHDIDDLREVVTRLTQTHEATQPAPPNSLEPCSNPSSDWKSASPG